MTDTMPQGPLLASRQQRLTATLIDAVLVPSLTIFIVMITDVMEDAEDYIDNWWILHVFLQAVASYLLLNAYTLWRYGQTLGKRIMRIAIVSSKDMGGDETIFELQSVPLWRLLLLRAPFFALLFAAILPPLVLLPVFDLLFIFGSSRRCLHDWLSGTVVVRMDQP